jgi:hypothetical protein
MGWGTSFTIEIYLSKKIYNSKSELIDEIDQLKDYINTSKERILQYASSNIKDILPEEYKNNPLEWVHLEVTDIMSDLIENTKELQLLTLYLEEFDNLNNIKNE